MNSVKADKDWIIYGDNVYNVRPFIPHHPGGDLLIKHVLYTDCTDHLGKFHPKYVTDEKLPNYIMGKIDEKTFPPLKSRSKVSVAFRSLEKKMEEEGLFKPAYFYYIREFTKSLALFSIAVYMTLQGPTTLMPVVLAAFLHAFGN